jgi:hypothetical protein
MTGGMTGGPAEGGAGRARTGTTGGGLEPFEYAVLRAVPRVDRGESMNVAVVLYCQAAQYLECITNLDEDWLRKLDPAVDVAAVRGVLRGIEAICAGRPEAGPAGREPVRVRFGWLTAPRSTVVQPGPVHCGLTEDPDGQLASLATRLLG